VFFIFNGPIRSGAGDRNMSFGSTVLVPTAANLNPGCYLQVF